MQNAPLRERKLTGWI